ncbi:MAG: acyl-CoA synthetase FdrA [Rhodovulum sp.]|nr:acyl-CoA synthetase FdrA [Rhodovulum sp.]
MMTILVNEVRRGFYMDSVALMRISRSVGAMPGVKGAALMIGSVTNKALMRDAGLLGATGEDAGPNDLVLAVRAESEEAATTALSSAAGLLDKPPSVGQGTSEWLPKTLDTAVQQLPGANLVLISVPGEFATAEARRALRRGLNVLMFSDNVPLADEVALKQEAQQRGLLMMGPDCGTAIIGGTPLAFANEVPRGSIGLVGASGTGLQEVSTLIGRSGAGVSHAIGVGGRDLKEAVGGITTLMAIDALDRDPGTEQIVIISKPPAPSVAKRVLQRVGESRKPVTVCVLGVDDMALPANAVLVSDLRSAAERALGGGRLPWSDRPTVAALAATIGTGRRRIAGLFCGGTLCGEAQLMLRRAGLVVSSNAPVTGVATPKEAPGAHRLLDLGDDEYTVGRPHPMIDPSLRDDMVRAAFTDPEVAVVLVDVVIGYGAHDDPATDLVAVLPAAVERGAVVIASVCGTDQDRQGYARQVGILRDAGVVVAPSNAHAAELAAELAGALAAAGGSSR